MKKCTLIVPCYNEETTIPYFYKETTNVISSMQDLKFEFLFLDDGSSDGTLEEIKKLAQKDSRVHYISFSRNFGKEAALFAGLENAKGDYIVTMDVDLQDPPSLLPEMYESVKEGYDCAATRRVTRKGEPPIRSFFARMFYRIINKISKADIVDGARDYRFMTRQMVDAIISMREYNRFSKGIFGWVGFKTKWIAFENVERIAGETKWSFWKLFLYSLEGIVAFSTAPLAFVSFLGLIVCILSIFGMFFIFIRAAIWGDPVSGWPSMICIMTMLGGIQLLCLGIIGYYLSKTYLETKNRPIYICKEQNVNPEIVQQNNKKMQEEL